MDTPLKALIIGAGSIGGLIDSPESEVIASHAHAYASCDKTQLKAICEPNETNLNAFMDKWGEFLGYGSIDDIDWDEPFDIASISSSTSSHFHDLMALIRRPDCPMILCEKPIVSTKEEFHSLVTELKKTKKKILIHLIRRYNPAFIALAKRIHAGEFGRLLGFQGVCTKGLLHNGSHLLGVLSHFFGNITSIKPFGASHCSGDVCGEFGVSFEQGGGAISVLSHLSYSLFELTIWFDNSAIKIMDGGEKIEIHSRIPSETYEGYFTLSHSETVQTNLSLYALDSIEFLIHESDEVCEEILQEHLHIHEHIFQTIAKVYP